MWRYIVTFEVKYSFHVIILYHAYIWTLLVSKDVLVNPLRVEQKDLLKNLDATGGFVSKQMVTELLETESSETIHM